MPAEDLPDRFWQKVNFYGPVPVNRPELGPCWLWLAALDKDGYGLFKVGKTNKRTHRLTHEALIGPIPEGLEPDHLCRVRACCNPWHGEPVTKAENIRRGEAGRKSGELQRAKTHCPKGHLYDERNTTISRRADGEHRHCKTCKRESTRRWRDASKRQRR